MVNSTTLLTELKNIMSNSKKDGFFLFVNFVIIIFAWGGTPAILIDIFKPHGFGIIIFFMITGIISFVVQMILQIILNKFFE
jgi:hypothetical protein